MTKASDNVYPRFLISEGGSTATPAAGRVTMYAKADGLLYSKDDAGAESAVSGGGSTITYSDWTPALTAASVNPTLGSGSTAAGRYFQNGKHVSAEGRIVFGSSGVAAGTGVYRISLPVTASATPSRVYGHAYLYDDSGGVIKVVMISYVSTTTGQFLGDGIVPASDNTPWVWAANDALVFHLDYEAA